MDELRIKEYQKEIEASISGMRQALAQCQSGLSILETFLYLIRKESERKEEKKEISKEIV